MSDTSRANKENGLLSPRGHEKERERQKGKGYCSKRTTNEEENRRLNGRGDAKRRTLRNQEGEKERWRVGRQSASDSIRLDLVCQALRRSREVDRSGALDGEAGAGLFLRGANEVVLGGGGKSQTTEIRNGRKGGRRRERKKGPGARLTWNVSIFPEQLKLNVCPVALVT